MINLKIETIADIVVKSNKSVVQDKDIIVYGLKAAITQLVCLIYVVILGCIFELFLENIVFLIAFSSIRMYAGGYHCQKKINCYFMSSIILVIELLIIKLMLVNLIIPTILFLLIVSIPIIFKLVPVETKNKPLDEKEKKIYRKIVIRNLLIQVIIINVLLFLNLYTLSLSIASGVFLSALLVFVENFKNRKN